MNTHTTTNTDHRQLSLFEELMEVVKSTGKLSSKDLSKAIEKVLPPWGKVARIKL